MDHLSKKRLPSDHIVDDTQETRNMCRACWSSKMMKVFSSKNIGKLKDISSDETEKLYNNSYLTCGQTHV